MMSDVMAGGLNATEAIARGFGLKSHAEQRAERDTALKVRPGISGLGGSTPSSCRLSSHQIIRRNHSLHWAGIASAMMRTPTHACGEYTHSSALHVVHGCHG